MKDKKKIITGAVGAVLAVVLIVGFVGSLLSRSDESPPELESVYDRLVYLVEESLTLNTVLFNDDGLPAYKRDSDLANLSRMYNGMSDGWEYVMGDYTRFKSTEEIGSAMAQVYSRDFRTSLEERLFTGISTGVGVISIKYTDDPFIQWVSDKEPEKKINVGMRFYDYSSMTVLPESSETCLKVSVRSYSEKTPDTWEDRTLTFVYENGDWYLDGPTY